MHKCSTEDKDEEKIAKEKRNYCPREADGPLDFIKQAQHKNESKPALKAYNFIHNAEFKPLVDDPETVNYIIEVMRQQGNFSLLPSKKENLPSNQDRHNSNRTGRKHRKRDQNNHHGSAVWTSTNSWMPSPRSSTRQGCQQTKFDPQRRTLWKLNEWVTEKMNEHRNDEKSSGTIITQRIHALHFAFSEACRQTAKYSQEVAKVLSNVHGEYHSMYECLVSCLMKQNLAIKKRSEEAEQKINAIILHYEQELANIRSDFDKKSAKVIENFHKCIGMKQDLETENKSLLKELKNEKNKLNFMEEGLAKAIQILVQIGQNKFSFLSPEQNQAILNINSDFRNEPHNYKLFHKWCSTILKIISNMKENSIQIRRTKEKEKQKEKYEENIKHLKKFALSSIGKFMIDFDSTLSIKDAEAILLDFITHHKSFSVVNQFNHEKHEEEEEMLWQSINDGTKEFHSTRKNEQLIDIFDFHQRMEKEKGKAAQSADDQNISVKQPATFIVPNLFDISEKFKGINVETQTKYLIDCEDKGIQTIGPELVSYAVMAKPKATTKETTTFHNLRSRLRVMSISSMQIEIWGERECPAAKGETQNNLKRFKQSVVKKMSVITAMTSFGPNTKRASRRFDMHKIEDGDKSKGKKKEEDGVKIQSRSEKEMKITLEDETSKQAPLATQTAPVNIKGSIGLDKQLIKKHKSPQKRVNFSLKKGEVITNQDKVPEVQIKTQNRIAEDIPQPAKDSKLISKRNELLTITNKLIMVQSKDDPIINMKERRQKSSKTLWQKEEDQADKSKYLFLKESKSLTYIKDIDDDESERGNSRGWDKCSEGITVKRKNARMPTRAKELLERQKAEGLEKSKGPKMDKLDIHGFHIKNSPSLGINKLGSIGSNPFLKADGKEEAMISLIMVPKRNQKHEQTEFSTHSRDFMAEMVELLQMKNKKITESTMWNHKKNVEIERFVHKLHLSKEKIMPTPGNLEVIANCLTNHLDPVVRAYLKMYSRLVESENMLSNDQLKNQLLKGKRICYYHRLAPLLSVLINVLSLSCFGVGKCTKYITTFYRGMKNLKAMDRSYEISELLIDGGTIELDVFVKIIHYLSEERQTQIKDQYVQINVIELQLFFILDSYFTPGEINSLINDIKNAKKDGRESPNKGRRSEESSGQDGINLQTLTLCVLKAITHKKGSLMRKYRQILQILSPDNVSASFTNLVYFISIFPTDKKTRHKILFQSALYLVYWDKKEGTIPIDRLLFLFESLRFISGEALEKNLIIEYFKIKCESQFKEIYDKISRNPDYVVDSVYRLLYRIPEMVFRLTKELKTNKEARNNIFVLTVLYNLIIQDQLEKVYVSGHLNALAAIPMTF